MLIALIEHHILQPYSGKSTFRLKENFASVLEKDVFSQKLIELTCIIVAVLSSLFL